MSEHQRQAALIEKASKGARITRADEPLVMFDVASEAPCENGHHQARVILCDGDRDVIECAMCGKQKVVTCSFDEDMS